MLPRSGGPSTPLAVCEAFLDALVLGDGRSRASLPLHERRQEVDMLAPLITASLEALSADPSYVVDSVPTDVLIRTLKSCAMFASASSHPCLKAFRTVAPLYLDHLTAILPALPPTQAVDLAYVTSRAFRVPPRRRKTKRDPRLMESISKWVRALLSYLTNADNISCMPMRERALMVFAAGELYHRCPGTVRESLSDAVAAIDGEALVEGDWKWDRTMLKYVGQIAQAADRFGVIDQGVRRGIATKALNDTEGFLAACSERPRHLAALLQVMYAPLLPFAAPAFVDLADTALMQSLQSHPTFYCSNVKGTWLLLAARATVNKAGEVKRKLMNALLDAKEEPIPQQVHGGVLVSLFEVTAREQEDSGDGTVERFRSLLADVAMARMGKLRGSEREALKGILEKERKYGKTDEERALLAMLRVGGEVGLVQWAVNMWRWRGGEKPTQEGFARWTERLRDGTELTEEEREGLIPLLWLCSQHTNVSAALHVPLLERIIKEDKRQALSIHEAMSAVSIVRHSEALMAAAEAPGTGPFIRHFTVDRIQSPPWTTRTALRYITAMLHQVLPFPQPDLRPHLDALAMQGEQLLDRANAGGEGNMCETRDICRFVNVCVEGNVGDVTGILSKGMLALGRWWHDRRRDGDVTVGIMLERVEEILCDRAMRHAKGSNAMSSAFGRMMAQLALASAETNHRPIKGTLANVLRANVRRVCRALDRVTSRTTIPLRTLVDLAVALAALNVTDARYLRSLRSELVPVRRQIEARQADSPLLPDLAIALSIMALGDEQQGDETAAACDEARWCLEAIEGSVSQWAREGQDKGEVAMLLEAYRTAGVGQPELIETLEASASPHPHRRPPPHL
ncbi:unnamed protein product [Vitrella brassicaformis CCMP3155]|uniref:Uncharacterized protein n=3 Tax=Vitrella brassicaformis TaxID=1169539 RepID=A0A0G4GD07_VITBC|nr:unnamed protein product [Vitrella brassicaformis CCMP3155]|eukprot:CEM27065.1 unnamed protein product [Vitrella brassicaformis CCMP3155]